MRIGFGGICRGYAADKIREQLQSIGIRSGTIKCKGSLLAWGKAANNTPWTIGIADPTQDKLPFARLPLDGMAINTLWSHKSKSLKYPNECTLLTPERRCN